MPPPPLRRLVSADLRSLSRYTVVGVLSVVIDIGLLVGLHSGLSVNLVAATTAAFWTSLAFNFALNRLWVFPGGRSMSLNLAKYLTLVGVNYAVTVGLVAGLDHVGFPYVAAKAVAVAVTTAWNYLAYKGWVFT